LQRVVRVDVNTQSPVSVKNIYTPYAKILTEMACSARIP
jgi:hypothetical protein